MNDVKENNILAIDLGSNSIRIAIGKDLLSGKSITQFLSLPSYGIKNGTIYDFEQVRAILNAGLKSIYQKEGSNFKERCILNLSGKVYFSKNIKVEQKFSKETQIRTKTINDLFLSIPEEDDYIPVHICKKSFLVDNSFETLNPSGMFCKSLQANFHVIYMLTTYYKTLKELFNSLYLDLVDILPSSIASANAILKENDFQISKFLVVDIGALTTDFVLYSSGTPEFTSSVILGSENITRDISFGLKIKRDEAEKLKIDFSESNDEDDFRKFLKNIIYSRSEDIVLYIYDKLKGISDNMLPLRIYLTGQGVKLIVFKKLFEEIFDCPVEIRRPLPLYMNEKRDYEHSTVLGLIYYALNNTILSNNYDDKNIIRKLCKVIFKRGS
ncbi:cell division FtsA domain-containing protein [Thermodesulfobium sp.]|jgi:cell division protein FtsA|uniref:SHS2 domain-containing protein n=1 Tax=Thermodesulfobium narugense TaxID=184064 RepID=A0A7C5PHF8_9BACT